MKRFISVYSPLLMISSPATIQFCIWTSCPLAKFVMEDLALVEHEHKTTGCVLYATWSVRNISEHLCTVEKTKMVCSATSIIRTLFIRTFRLGHVQTFYPGSSYM